jgi:hypothetical protein
VISVTPDDHETGVGLSQIIEVEFSEPLAGDSIDQDAVRLTLDEEPVAGTVTQSPDGKTLQFRAETPLRLAALYSLAVSADLRDRQRNRVAEEYRWSFTTTDGLWGEAMSVAIGLPVSHFRDVRVRAGIINGGDAIAFWASNDNAVYVPSSIRDGWGAAYFYPATTEAFLAPDGTMVLVWWEYDEVADAYPVRVRRIPRGGIPYIELVGIVAAPYRPEGIAISASPDGELAVGWVSRHNEDTQVWANRFTPTEGWATAQPLGSVSRQGDDRNLQLASFGNPSVTVAVWENHGVLTARWESPRGWLPVQRIDLGSATDTRPRIGSDRSGGTIAVWQQTTDREHYDVWWNRYTPGVGWDTARPLEHSNRSATEPRIGADARGNAIAVWCEQEESRRSIWSSRYQVANGWTEPVRIEGVDFGDASSPSIAVDGHGNAIAAWAVSQMGTPDFPLLDQTAVSRFLVAGGWQPARLASERIDLHVVKPVVAMSDDGRGLVVWRGHRENNTSSVWTVQFR